MEEGKKTARGVETKFGVLALLWLRLWKMFHRFIKTLNKILVQNTCLHSWFYLHVVNALRWKTCHLIGSLFRTFLSEGLFLSLFLSCTHIHLNHFFFLSFPSSPVSLHAFRVDKQRPHLTAGQGKCLSHLLQETWRPQEMWRWSWGCAPGTGRPWTRTERETQNAEQGAFVSRCRRVVFFMMWLCVCVFVWKHFSEKNESKGKTDKKKLDKHLTIS